MKVDKRLDEINFSNILKLIIIVQILTNLMKSRMTVSKGNCPSFLKMKNNQYINKYIAAFLTVYKWTVNLYIIFLKLIESGNSRSFTFLSYFLLLTDVIE